MGKKRSASKRERRPRGDTGKAVFQCRLDADVHAALSAAASEADISLNQLIGGVCRWAAGCVVQGEPRRDDNGVLRAAEQAGCVFFGTLGHYWSEDEIQDRKIEGEDVSRPWNTGVMCFALDFTERHVVREDEIER